MSAPEGVGSAIAQPTAAVFRRAGRRVAIIGTVTAVTTFAAGAAGGGRALAGAAWGSGAGLALTLITAVVLLVPWQRFPLLASGGVMLSFAAKIAVMVGVVLLAGPHREEFSGTWFLASLALALIVVTAVEVVTLAAGRTLVVESERGADPAPSRPADAR